MTWPSISKTTSPGCSPALSALEPSNTSAISTPNLPYSSSKASRKSDVKSCTAIPTWPRRTSPKVRICSITACAMFTGIANPIPTFPPAGAMIAVLIPTSSPFKFTNAPPEFPGLIQALVRIKFSKPIPIPLRPKALTIPVVNQRNLNFVSTINNVMVR